MLTGRTNGRDGDWGGGRDGDWGRGIHSRPSTLSPGVRRMLFKAVT